MLELDLAKAQELVKMAVDSKPDDYVYEKSNTGNCVYVDYKSEYNDLYHCYDRVAQAPSCLVGHALVLGGVEMDDFLSFNDAGVTNLIDEFEPRGVLKATSSAVKFLNDIQYSQDAGTTWRDAYEHALKGERFRARRTWMEGDTDAWVKED